MKRKLLLIACLLAGCTPSHPRFLGLGWGTSRDQVIETFLATTGHTAKPAYDSLLGQTPRFVNFKLYGLSFDEAMFSFRENELSEFNLSINSSSVRVLDSAFVELAGELVNSLGPPTLLECRNYKDSLIFRRASWVLDRPNGERDRVAIVIDYSSWLSWFGFQGYSNGMREGNMDSPGESETTPCEVVLAE